MIEYFASSLDRLFSAVVLSRYSRAKGNAIPCRLLDLYGDPQFIERPETFFIEPPAAEPQLRTAGDRVVDVCYPSEYRPFNPEVEREYLSCGRNSVCAVRLFLTKGRSRGTAIFLHGYLGGVYLAESKIWPIESLRARGFNSALFTLPFHAARGSWTELALLGSDPRITIEALRQAIHDLRRFVGWLKEQGLTPVGTIGMSVGGYACALLATIESSLSFVVPWVPLASIAKFALDGGRFAGSKEQQLEQWQLVEQVYRVVSPLVRPSQVPRRACLVVGGRADAIAPIQHAQMIAEHFGAPLETFIGGHLLQIGRSRALGQIRSLLETIH